MTTPTSDGGLSSRIPRLVRDLFREGPRRWPYGAEGEAVEYFLRFTHDAGIQPLVYDLLESGPVGADWPGEIRERLRAEARKRAAMEALRREELAGLCDDLAAEGIRALLFKGVPLAYLVYPAPYLRPVLDTDLLVGRGDLERAGEVLCRRGYRRQEAIGGELVLRQAAYKRETVSGVEQTVDLHWAISYRALFAAMFPIEDLLAGAIPIPALGEHAWTADYADALLLACIHRAGHHAECERLIWLYDIHLLLTRMTKGALERVVERAVNHGIGILCRGGCEEARDWFGTRLPPGFLEALRGDGGREVSEVYLRDRRNRFAEMVVDLRALASWRDRLRLLKEHLFPGAAYLRARYPGREHTPLVFLYIGRILGGVRKAWGRRPG